VPVRDLKSIVLAAVFVCGLALPHSVLAQATDNPDSAVVDEQPSGDSPPDMSPPEVQQEEDPAAAPAAAPPAIPDYRVNGVYLNRLQGIRSAWETLEFRVEDLARQQRLGTVRPTVMAGAARTFPRVVDTMEQRLTELSVPPQFAHVQQLHLSAAGEFRAAIDAAESWLTTGDLGGLRGAEAHFAVFDRLIGQALFELS
jgi:hypothetical protein